MCFGAFQTRRGRVARADRNGEYRQRIPDYERMGRARTGPLHKPMGAGKWAALCDLGVFMYEPAESIASAGLNVGLDEVG